MADDRHAGTLESLVLRLLALAVHCIPPETEGRSGLAQRVVYDAFAELLDHDFPDFRNERELYRRLAESVVRRIKETGHSDVS